MISVITGLPGMGKTVILVSKGIQALKQGKDVYSNVQFDFSLCPSMQRYEKNFHYVDDMRQIVGTVENALLLIDEMSVVFDAFTMYNLPPSVWANFRQHRKDGVDIVGTSQSFNDFAYPIQRLVQYEYRILSRLSRFITVSVLNPRSKERFGRRFYYRSGLISRLYNTNQRVGECDDLPILIEDLYVPVLKGIQELNIKMMDMLKLDV